MIDRTERSQNKERKVKSDFPLFVYDVYRDKGFDFWVYLWTVKKGRMAGIRSFLLSW